MGSLRNPIGPLPSSIYWRRRAVALAVLALLVLLIVWAFSLGGGGGSSDQGKGGGGGGPAGTITPGPSDPGPAITERPGGRDTGGGTGGTGGSGAGGADAGGAGSGGSGGAGGGAAGPPVWAPGPGSGTDAESTTGGGSAAGGGAGGGGSAGGDAGKGLPDCGPSAVSVSLSSVKDTYEAGEKPKFELTAKNSRGSACKIDLGRAASVVTVKDSAGDKVWASDDCPREDSPVLAEIPANGESTHTLTWLRKPSAANCGTPPAGSAKPGKYEVELKLHALKTLKTKFELA